MLITFSEELMKKSIFLLLVITIIFACSPRKDAFINRKMQGFTTYYNTLYNSKDALNTEMKNRKKSYQDNFYEPYIRILKTETQPLGSNLATNPTFGNTNNSANAAFRSTSPNNNGMGQNSSTPSSGNIPFGDGYSGGGKPGMGKGSTVLEISEAKALKAITKHSMEFSGVQKNKDMFDAYILLAQSRLYQGKNLEALDALNYIFSHMKNDKRIDLAKVYQGQVYAKMGDYYKANEIFADLSKKDKVKKEYQRLMSIYYSEMLLDSGKKQEAVDELETAFTINKDSELRSRIAFLRGQILASLDKKQEARESFVTAYKYANDFQFEVKSQVEIAKTFNGSADDYEGAKKYLEGISKKGTYASRKNELYYALGIMANTAGKTDEANTFFHQAIKEKISDPQIRGLTYFELGQNFYKKDDYLSAGAYYDSAVTAMTYKPKAEELKILSENIKKLSQNFYLMKKNDSILTLSKMSMADRDAYFQKYIDKLKDKEAKIALAQQKADRSKGFVVADFASNNSISSDGMNYSNSFANNSSGSNKFYYANQATVAKGSSDFKQVWGDRALADNWRYSNRTTTIEDLKNKAMGVESVQNPRRFETSFYTEKIPTDVSTLAALKKDRDTAQLGVGRMYYDYFSNRPLATKTLYTLIDQKPEEDVKLKALYQLFAMNYQDNPQDAARAKDMILSEFPYTPYAEFVRNPKNSSFNKSDVKVEEQYIQAYDLYAAEKYEESQNIIQKAIADNPKDGLVPKFSLLSAYNTGKIAGKEVMILQLEQIALNYPRTNEGEKAKELLKYLKSDLNFEATDNQGNKVSGAVPNNNQPQPINQATPLQNNDLQPVQMAPVQNLDVDQKLQENKNKQKEKPKQKPIDPSEWTTPN